MAKRNWWLVIVIAVVVATACSTTTPTSAPTGAPTSPPTDVPGPTAAPTSPPTDVPGPTDAPTSSPTDVPPPSADAVPEVPTGFAELDAALGADQPMKRTKVTIQVPWIGVEGDNFENSLGDFEAATGIDVVVDRVASSHETVLRTRIDVNDPTLNLAMLSQPAAILAYGAEGKMVDVNSFMTGTNLADEHPATIGLYTNESGATYGVPYKVDVKSTVWYPIKAFGAAGYSVPTTWDELIDLSQRIVDEQGESNPWCIGMEDGSETGGQATDWLEDIMLRTTSVENYNKWITHELPFNSPEVLDAMNLAGQIFFTPDFVLGGPEGAISIHQTDAMDPMFPTDG
ncbi:MAG: extracellular solute-binding protein, partial [Chloroflexota bacterium]